MSDAGKRLVQPGLRLLPRAPKGLFALGQRLLPHRLAPAVNFLPGRLKSSLVFVGFGRDRIAMLFGARQRTARRRLAVAKDLGERLEEDTVQDDEQSENQESGGRALGKQGP